MSGAAPGLHVSQGPPARLVTPFRFSGQLLARFFSANRSTQTKTSCTNTAGLTLIGLMQWIPERGGVVVVRVDRRDGILHLHSVIASKVRHILVGRSLIDLEQCQRTSKARSSANRLEVVKVHTQRWRTLAHNGTKRGET